MCASSGGPGLPGGSMCSAVWLRRSPRGQTVFIFIWNSGAEQIHEDPSVSASRGVTMGGPRAEGPAAPAHAAMGGPRAEGPAGWHASLSQYVLLGAAASIA